MTRIIGEEYTEIAPMYDVKRSPGLDCSAMMAVPDHRSGWNYVNSLLSDLHDPKGYILVDFVEKIWCWNKIATNEMKGVYFEDKSYYVNSDEIRMINGMEYVLITSTIFNTHAAGTGEDERPPDESVSERALYWNGTQWIESTLPIDVVRNADRYGIFTVPWVGIIHNPTNMPKWFDYENSPQVLVQNQNFNKSLAHCKGLIVFSEYLKNELLKLGGWPCSISVLYHPTEPCSVKWQDKFVCTVVKRLNVHKLVQIGYWLRKMTSIWEVRVPKKWKKYWVNRAEYGFKCLEKEIMNDNKLLTMLQNGSNVEIKQLSNDAYDEFLADSVVFLDLYDSSCNNVIIECIVRHVPIVVKRMPATIEYLGEDYCLFFDTLDEVYNILNNQQLIQHAYEQLQILEESGKFYGNHFTSCVKELSFMSKNEPLCEVTPGGVSSNIVSLGVDCLPRAMSTKFNFKKTKAEGELSCPFDLAWHDYETVCRLINNDFNDYQNTTRLYVNENGHISHRDYSIVFNHESDDAHKLLDYIKGDYVLFRERYANRIKNFNDLLHINTVQKSKVVFLLHYKEYPIELVSIIKKKYPGLNFTILTINCPYSHETYLQQPTNVENDTEGFLFYTIKKPFEDYLWYVHNDDAWEALIEDVYATHLPLVELTIN